MCRVRDGGGGCADTATAGRRHWFYFHWPCGLRSLFRHASNLVGISFFGLAQDQRQPSDIGCEQNFLRVLGTNLKCHGLSNGRLLGAFASDLIDGENLGGLQDDI